MDFYCGKSDCDAGSAAVRGLVQYHDYLGRPKKYEAAVEAIYAEWEKARGSWGAAEVAAMYPTAALIGRWCCSIKEIGSRAERLQEMMAKDYGMEAGPKSHLLTDEQMGILEKVGLLAVTLAAIWGGVKVYQSYKGGGWAAQAATFAKQKYHAAISGRRISRRRARR
jgi:hypothetical protein